MFAIWQAVQNLSGKQQNNDQKTWKYNIMNSNIWKYFFFLSDVHTTSEVDSEELLNIQNVGDPICLLDFYYCNVATYSNLLKQDN